ncbi:lysophospholipid acyltransferase family protein [bacterium]|nr:lysophospholipid acyltransferase family protein [bacterium]MCG2676405.1 lysophospholipid acyltransferase family protein [bacterium]
MLKRLRKKIRHSLGGIVLYGILLPIRLLPLNLLLWGGRCIGHLAYYVDRKHRGIGLKNIEMALGKGKTPRELKRIIKENYCHIAQSGFEMIRALEYGKRYAHLLAIEGKENLDRALAKGKGAIGIMGHIGNITLLLRKIANEGYPASVIAKDTKDERVSRLMQELRDRSNIGTVPPKPKSLVAKRALTSLKKGELLIIPIDQNAGKEGVFVDFFGRLASTPAGPVIFAQRTGAPLVPMYIIREGRKRHRLIIETEVPLVNTENKEEDLITNTQRLTRIIERYVRKYPSQWWWMHNRWKSKPAQKQENEKMGKWESGKKN